MEVLNLKKSSTKAVHFSYNKYANKAHLYFLNFNSEKIKNKKAHPEFKVVEKN